ncbi:hypothetical protein [Candidatus Absconditicoccus praedator]|uniref:hypothetical protein n=1 Tax=Candidatus Absconditicoccus praedator TaxID=2735562 RepID=UPI001E46ACBE|nr:hypothetical protein [Candidatus Absconditicoccus praedator]UFX83013.1 hypothetical protein HLG78_02660 [Candidatus Absconditicoccus praedator]
MLQNEVLLAEAGITGKINQTIVMTKQIGEVIQNLFLEESLKDKVYQELDKICVQLSIEDHQDFIDYVVHYNKTIEQIEEDKVLIGIIFLISNLIGKLSFEKKQRLLFQAKYEANNYQNPIYSIFHFLKPLIGT